MKKITVSKLKNELIKLNASESVIDIITNNVELYNQILTEYKNGNKKNIYLLYQLNSTIIKQIAELRKEFNKQNPNTEGDDFTNFKNKFGK